MMTEELKTSFWRKTWVMFAAWTIGAAVSYFVLYPMLLIAMFDMMVSYESMPNNLEAAIQLSAAPIIWLAESCPPYDSLLAWIDDLFPDR